LLCMAWFHSCERLCSVEQANGGGEVALKNLHVARGKAH
jgi:hypothetical protein